MLITYQKNLFCSTSYSQQDFAVPFKKYFLSSLIILFQDSSAVTFRLTILAGDSIKGNAIFPFGRCWTESPVKFRNSPKAGSGAIVACHFAKLACHLPPYSVHENTARILLLTEINRRWMTVVLWCGASTVEMKTEVPPVRDSVSHCNRIATHHSVAKQRTNISVSGTLLFLKIKEKMHVFQCPP